MNKFRRFFLRGLIFCVVVLALLWGANVLSLPRQYLGQTCGYNEDRIGIKDEAMVTAEEIAVWQALRGRTLNVERLSPQEAATYAAITERLDAQEAATLDAAYLREARAARERMAASEAELARLHLRREELAAHIRELGAVLDEPARRALGVESVPANV